MGRTVVATALVVAVVFGLGVRANEKPTAEYQATMKSNGATFGALGMHIRAKDYDAIAKDGETLEGNFAKIVTFWTQKKVDDAVAFAKTVAKGAQDLKTAATAKNDEKIAAANMAITGACGSCHMAHREQLPDKTFEVK